MLSTDDIRRAVDREVFRSGRDDLKRRMVVSVLPKAGGQGCYGAVRDPGGRTHKCDVSWQARSGGGWTLGSQCSCRSVRPCRHMVAALLWLIEQGRSPLDDEAEEPSAAPAVPPCEVPPPSVASAPVQVPLPPAADAGRVPRPMLRLLRLEPASGPRGERVRDFAQLWFDYDGLRYSDDEDRAPLRRGEGAARREPPRDPVAERKARERLRGLGLFPADPARPSLLLPRSERDWLSLMAGPIPALADAGWQIEIDPDFSFRLHEPEPDWLLRLNDRPGGDWFGLSLDIMVEGQPLALLPLLLALLRSAGQQWTPQKFAALDDALPVILRDEAGGRWIRLAAGRLKPLLASLLELFEKPQLGDEGELWLPRASAAVLADLSRTPRLQFSGAEALRATAERLRNFGGLEVVPPPAGLQAQLRPYQQEGLNWLQFLREQGFGGVLADDMGLGKTLQTLAHLLVEKGSGRMDRPSLVIAPTSLMFNWQREAQRFAPALRVLVLQGMDRHAHHAQIGRYDLVLTTYPLLPRDFEALSAQDYHLLILDEAQNIKNSKSRAAQLVGQLSARHRLCVTGTPMENHLGEFWSLMHFLMPGFFGSEIEFKRRYRIPIEKHGDSAAREQLLRRARPFLLRRTKAEVAKELPPRTDILRSVPLEGAQRELYEAVRLMVDQKLRAAIATRGLGGSHIMVLDALLKLRQICCDPRLLPLEGGATVQQSAKLEMLMELLPEMIEEGRRILLFSQFTSMLALIEQRLQAAGIDYVKLTGETRDRQAVVERFQQGTVPLFLISLKAGGVGLNLTAADTVIHYDPWWNPAVEQQATDRAHRIGQDKPVFVYRLLTEGTVEQKIAELQERKRGLAEALLADAGGVAGWTADDLQELFAPL